MFINSVIPNKIPHLSSRQLETTISNDVNPVMKIMAQGLNKNDSDDQTNFQGSPRSIYKGRNKIICLFTFSIVLLCLSGIVITYLKYGYGSLTVINIVSDEELKNVSENSLLVPSESNSSLVVVSRLEWLAQPSSEPLFNLPTPVPYVIIHHTATQNCSTLVKCIIQVRFIQTFHIQDRHWLDIGYNFLVGGNGEVFEGRGWTFEGAHSKGYNSKSIGIAFIGGFDSVKPTESQISACKKLIRRGVKLGYVRRDYKLLAARQVALTGSPGAALYEDMKTWDHFSTEV